MVVIFIPPKLVLSLVWPSSHAYNLHVDSNTVSVRRHNGHHWVRYVVIDGRADIVRSRNKNDRISDTPFS